MVIYPQPGAELSPEERKQLTAQAFNRFATIQAAAASLPECSVLQAGIFAMKPVAVFGLSEQCGGWAMDARGHVYFDVHMVLGAPDRETGEPTPLITLAADFLHEVWHFLREHPERFKALALEDHPDARKWNIAADAEINGTDTFLRANLQKWAVWPEKLISKHTKIAFPAHTFQTAEWFYANILLEQGPPPPKGPPECPSCGAGADQLVMRPCQPPRPGFARVCCDACGWEEEKELSGEGEGKGTPIRSELPPEENSGGEGEGKENGDGDSGEEEKEGKGNSAEENSFDDRWDCGADGEGRPWEVPEEEDSGLSPGDAEDIRRTVAQAVQEGSRSMGNIPGHWEAWAGAELAPPKVPWQQKLQRFLRYATTISVGASDFTYQRRSRRQAAVGRRITLPASYSPKLEVAVVIDTSGSMSDDDLNRACSEVDGILRACGASAQVICADAQVTASQRITSARNIELSGRGGTDMRVGLRAAAKSTPTPHAIILLSDGYTPWPKQGEIKTPIVVGLIGRNCGVDSVPEWVDSIVVDD